MRKKSLKTLKKELDRVYSEYIRVRHSSRGHVSCVSCGVRLHWKKMQCGHYVSRRHLSTRWEDRNCAPQCARCNIFLRGNMPWYSKWLIDRYGPSVIELLIAKSREIWKPGRAEIEERIEEAARMRDFYLGRAKKKIGDAPF